MKRAAEANCGPALFGSEGIRKQDVGVLRSQKNVCEEFAERSGDSAATAEAGQRSRRTEKNWRGKSDNLRLAGTGPKNDEGWRRERLVGAVEKKGPRCVDEGQDTGVIPRSEARANTLWKAREAKERRDASHDQTSE